MKLNRNQRAFFALVKAGLWEQNVQLSQYGKIDFKEVYRLSQEQSVVGLVAAGLEHVTDYAVPKDDVLSFVGTTLQLEQRNHGMNQFLAMLNNKLNEEKIKAILVKGQGVAQCYERPLWRAAGDIDLLLSSESYERAKSLLIPLAEYVDKEDVARKHLPIKMKGYDVELHGSMPFVLSKRVDCVIEEAIEDTLEHNGTSSWNLKGRDILLPNSDYHIVIVFTHFLHHFFIEGIGLRQICDWCRLMWVNKDSLDNALFEMRLRKAGLLSEWRTFAALAVNTLGMPSDAMPLYQEGYDHKANKVLSHILKSGNMGHNNDVSYRGKFPAIVSNIITFWRRFIDFASLVPVFPIDSPKFFLTYVMKRVQK